jgi:hypothetical protein
MTTKAAGDSGRLVDAVDSTDDAHDKPAAAS